MLRECEPGTFLQTVNPASFEAIDDCPKMADFNKAATLGYDAGEGHHLTV